MDGMTMTGRVALVTGAGRMRGIGRATALRLAKEGASVVVSSAPRDPSTYPEDEQAIGWRGVKSVAEEIEALGGCAIGIECDVSKPDQVASLFAKAEQALGAPDAVVNNAGSASGFGDNPIIDSDDNAWRAAIDININGTYYMCKAAGQAMRAAGKPGAIVNISSLAGRMGYLDCGAYCASKFAIIGITQQLALEYARLGIRVNCVCPGATQTDMMRGTMDRTALASGATLEATLAAIGQSIPLGRIGEPDDPAAAIVFLLSPNASYITGQSLNVCGGLRMD
jgi:NAD(P)-dependent dehydrogenase (short-subunit alcohol dehydrogenase family)